MKHEKDSAEPKEDCACAEKNCDCAADENCACAENENAACDAKENCACGESNGETAGVSENGEQLDPIAALEKKVAELEKENADLKNQALYKIAEFDNYRKRMIKEKQDAFDFANEKLLKDLLDSLDNFDRTVEAAANATDVSAIVDGVKMVNANLVKMLEEKHNLSSYGKAGEPFNPDEHEAIGSVQGDVAEPTLKEVYLKGYKLKDRVIRHAKVMVEMPV